MANYLFYIILQLRGFIILMLAVIILAFIGVLVMMGMKKKGFKDFKLQAFFFGRTWKEILLVCLMISEIVLVLSVFIFNHTVETVHLFGIALLVIFEIILDFSIGAVLSNLIAGGISVGGLLIGSLLFDFMTETGFDIYIFLIWLMLAVFIVALNIYISIRNTERMLEHHVDGKERKQKRKNRENLEEA